MSNLLFDPIKTQACITDTILVGFSCGKDSAVTLDLCTRYFKHVLPYFLFITPNLSFQEDILSSYERRYGFEIIRLPHPMVSEFLRYGSFRNPNMDVPVVGINDIYSYLRQKTGACWVAAGERISDSIVRRAMIKHSGTIDQQRARIYPIANWKKSDVLRYIKLHKLKLGSDYRNLGFSFRSLEGRELLYVKDNHPKDYERILSMYPFAEAAVERYLTYEQG